MTNSALIKVEVLASLYWGKKIIRQDKYEPKKKQNSRTIPTPDLSVVSSHLIVIQQLSTGIL